MTTGIVNISAVPGTFDVSWKRDKAGKISLTAKADPRGTLLPSKKLYDTVGKGVAKSGPRSKEWEKDVKQLTGYNPFCEEK